MTASGTMHRLWAKPAAASSVAPTTGLVTWLNRKRKAYQTTLAASIIAKPTTVSVPPSPSASTTGTDSSSAVPTWARVTARREGRRSSG